MKVIRTPINWIASMIYYVVNQVTGGGDVPTWVSRRGDEKKS